ALPDGGAQHRARRSLRRLAGAVHRWWSAGRRESPCCRSSKQRSPAVRLSRTRCCDRLRSSLAACFCRTGIPACPRPSFDKVERKIIPKDRQECLSYTIKGEG